MSGLMLIDEIMCHEKRKSGRNANPVSRHCRKNGPQQTLLTAHEVSGIRILFGRVHAKENSFNLMQQR